MLGPRTRRVPLPSLALAAPGHFSSVSPSPLQNRTLYLLLTWCFIGNINSTYSDFQNAKCYKALRTWAVSTYNIHEESGPVTHFTSYTPRFKIITEARVSQGNLFL